VGTPRPPDQDQVKTDSGSAAPATGPKVLHPAIPFAADHLPRVRDFNCGGDPWAVEVSNWIKGEPGTGGALDDMRNRGTQVWLYETEDGDIVGFSSLGVTKWRYPDAARSHWRDVLIIPNFAIALAYQGQPPGDAMKPFRYSRQIFGDLLKKALAHPSGLEIISLVVHEQNVGAIKLYTGFGFSVFGKPTQDGYRRMVATLCA
jgi:hypothetical protein